MYLNGFLYFIELNYLAFTPILLHVFNTKSKATPITPNAIENMNFWLSSDKKSPFQSNAYRLIAIITINKIKNTL